MGLAAEFAGGATASGGAAGAAQFAGLASSNPYLAGLSLLGSGGLFGKSESSSAAAYSGLGAFTVNANPVYNKPLVDLENPIHIAVLGVVLVGGLWAWKKYKG